MDRTSFWNISVKLEGHLIKPTHVYIRMLQIFDRCFRGHLETLQILIYVYQIGRFTLQSRKFVAMLNWNWKKIVLLYKRWFTVIEFFFFLNEINRMQNSKTGVQFSGQFRLTSFISKCIYGFGLEFLNISFKLITFSAFLIVKINPNLKQ